MGICVFVCVHGYVNINKGGCVGKCGCIYAYNISLGIVAKRILDFSNLCLIL